ncbi:hypothetical protein SDC9_199594 [bioreactor metagenome]|uniref:Uncharacterized protein n=1 Tax=bioreactor metagenome TaxID=1076179 RepID=A0A645IXL2_9ZZZZ
MIYAAPSEPGHAAYYASVLRSGGIPSQGVDHPDGGFNAVALFESEMRCSVQSAGPLGGAQQHCHDREEVRGIPHVHVDGF